MSTSNITSQNTNQSSRANTKVTCWPELPDIEEFRKMDKDAKEPYKKSIKACVNHLLREIRVEALEVSRISDLHISGQLIIDEYKDFLDATNKEVEQKIEEIREVHLKFLPPADYYSEIFNLWQLLSTSHLFHADEFDALVKKPKDLLRELKLLKDRLSRICFYIEYITGKERINSWLEKTKPGYVLPLHRIFEDELVSEDDRRKIINLYSLCPDSFENGFIEPSKGVIVCMPSDPVERFKRLSIIALTILGTFFVVYCFGLFLTLDDSKAIRKALEFSAQTEFNVSFIVLCWSALLFGIGGHILVAGAKEVNVEFRQFPLPISEWKRYLSAKTTKIIYKFALAIFVFLSLFVLLKGEMSILNAFLFGYSFDSVIELVGVSLEKRSSASVAAAKERLA